MTDTHCSPLMVHQLPLVKVTCVSIFDIVQNQKTDDVEQQRVQLHHYLAQLEQLLFSESFLTDQADLSYSYILTSAISVLESAPESKVVQQSHKLTLARVLLLLFRKASHRASVNLFMKLWQLMMAPFDDKNSKQSDEYQIALLEALGALLLPYLSLSSATENNAPEFSQLMKTENNYRVWIGYVIGTTLDLAVSPSKSRKVVWAALHYVHTVVQVLLAYKDHGLLTQVFPGMTERLLQIICGDYKQGSAVFRQAAEIWATLLITLFPNPLVTESTQDNITDALQKLQEIAAGASRSALTESPPSSSSSSHNPSETPVRHAFEMSSIGPISVAMHKIYECLSNLQQCNDWKRVDIISQFAGKVLVQSGRALYNASLLVQDTFPSSLLPAVHSLVNCLLVTYHHPYNDIQLSSRAALLQFKRENEEELSDIIHDNMIRQVVKQAEQHDVWKRNEESKLATVLLIQSQVELMGESIRSVLELHVEEWTAFFCQLLAPHLADLSVLSSVNVNRNLIPTIESSKVGDAEKQESDELEIAFIQSRIPRQFGESAARENQVYPTKTFQHFRSEEVYNTVLVTFEHIGKETKDWVLFDYLLGIVQQSSHPFRLAAVLLLNGIARGRFASASDLGHWHRLMHHYLSQEVFEAGNSDNAATTEGSTLVTSTVSGSSGGGTNAQVQRILFTCFLIEGLGVLADAAFSHQLTMTALLPLFVKLGGRNALISNYAWVTLNKICMSEQRGLTHPQSSLSERNHVPTLHTIQHLISANADYLLDTLSLQIKVGAHLYEDAPGALRALLMYAGPDVRLLSFISDLTDDLLRSVDYLRSSSFPALFDTILAVLLALLELQQHHPSHFLPLSAPSNMTTGTEEEEEESPPEAPPGLPRPIEVVVHILEKMQHFLASSQRTVKLQCLEIVRVSAYILHNKFSSALLPQIHALWQPLQRRLEEGVTEWAVVVKTLQVMQVLARCCRDFLREKVVSGTWPILVSLLRHHISLVQQPVFHSTIALEHSPSFKLQEAILSTMNYFVHHVEHLSVEFLQQIAKELVIFLADSQPQTLQRLAVKTFEGIILQNADCAWLLVGSLRAQTSEEPLSLQPSCASLVLQEGHEFVYNDIVFPVLPDLQLSLLPVSPSLLRANLDNLFTIVNNKLLC